MFEHVALKGLADLWILLIGVSSGSAMAFVLGSELRRQLRRRVILETLKKIAAESPREEQLGGQTLPDSSAEHDWMRGTKVADPPDLPARGRAA